MPKRLRPWNQALMWCVCFGLVGLFVALNARHRRELLPAAVFERLSATGGFVVLPRWSVDILRCTPGAACTSLGVTEVVFPQGVGSLEKALSKHTGATHARLVPISPVAPWAASQREPYAVLVLPRSVQNWVTLEWSQGPSGALWAGVGTTPRFTVPRQKLMGGEHWSLLFQVKGLPWFGPGDYPPAWVVASQSEDYALLPERLQQGASLMAQLELGLPVLFGAMALILDHALVFGALAVWALVRALRTAAVFWAVGGQVWPGAESLALFLEGAQCGLLVALTGLLSHTVEEAWLTRKALPTGAVLLLMCSLLGAAFVFAGHLVPGFLVQAHLWGDGLGACGSLGVLGAKGAHVLLSRSKKGLSQGPPPEVGGPMAPTLSQWAFQWGLMVVAFGFHGWVNIRDLFRAVDPWQRDPLDPRHIQLFPMLFAASLLGVGRMSRFVSAFAQKAVDVAVVEKEISYAKTVQERMLPPRKLEGPSWQVRRWHRAATGLAGDWFGVHGTVCGGHDVVLVCVADITGHGIGAALATGTLCSQWNLFCQGLPGDVTPHGAEREAWVLGALKHLHSGLLALGHNDTCTAIAMVLVPSLGQATVASAAHIGPLLLDPKGARYLTVPTGPCLGAQGSGGWTARHVDVGPGSHLLLFSDGIVPPGLTPSVWLKRWLREAQGRTPEASLKDMVFQIRANRRAFKSFPGREDDISLVGVSLKPGYPVVAS